MPLYEYECFVCSHRFERIQKISAEPIKTCPECGGSVRRLLNAPALQFKGSGWYVTDYGKGTGGAAGTARATGAPTESEKAAATSSSEAPKAEPSSASKGGSS